MARQNRPSALHLHLRNSARIAIRKSLIEPPASAPLHGEKRKCSPVSTTQSPEQKRPRTANPVNLRFSGESPRTKPDRYDTEETCSTSASVDQTLASPSSTRKRKLDSLGDIDPISPMKRRKGVSRKIHVLNKERASLHDLEASSRTSSSVAPERTEGSSAEVVRLRLKLVCLHLLRYAVSQRANDLQSQLQIQQGEAQNLQSQMEGVKTKAAKREVAISRDFSDFELEKKRASEHAAGLQAKLETLMRSKAEVEKQQSLSQEGFFRLAEDVSEIKNDLKVVRKSSAEITLLVSELGAALENRADCSDTIMKSFGLLAVQEEKFSDLQAKLDNSSAQVMHQSSQDSQKLEAFLESLTGAVTELSRKMYETQPNQTMVLESIQIGQLLRNELRESSINARHSMEKLSKDALERADDLTSIKLEQLQEKERRLAREEKSERRLDDLLKWTEQTRSEVDAHEITKQLLATTTDRAKEAEQSLFEYQKKLQEKTDITVEHERTIQSQYSELKRLAAECRKSNLAFAIPASRQNQCLHVNGVTSQNPSQANNLNPKTTTIEQSTEQAMAQADGKYERMARNAAKQLSLQQSVFRCLQPLVQDIGPKLDLLTKTVGTLQLAVAKQESRDIMRESAMVRSADYRRGEQAKARIQPGGECGALDAKERPRRRSARLADKLTRP